MWKNHRHSCRYLLVRQHRKRHLCVVKSLRGIERPRRRRVWTIDNDFWCLLLVVQRIPRLERRTNYPSHYRKISTLVSLARILLVGRQLNLPIQGSTHTITPRKFIDDLKVLDLGGAGSKALPNGLRDMRGEPKSPQELYDEKYFVKEAPLPQQAPLPKSGLLGPPKPSPTSSYSSSMSPSVKEEKKKKKWLGRFGGWGGEIGFFLLRLFITTRTRSRTLLQPFA